MKQKIKEALKNKYAKLGFGEKAFDGVADYLSQTVTEEGQIETAINGVENLLKAFQGDIDLLRTEKTKLNKELEELKKKNIEEPLEDKKTPKEEKDVQKMIDDAIAERLKSLQEKITDFESKEAKSARANLINSIKAKHSKITKQRDEEGYHIPEEWGEQEIDSFFSKVEKNCIASSLENKSSAFSISAPEEQCKELAKQWAESLPDAN